MAPKQYRFAKSKEEIGKKMAVKHIRENAEIKDKYSRKKAKYEEDASLVRDYRKGDFPDIEITFSSVIKLFQNLSEVCLSYVSNHKQLLRILYM